MFTAIGAKIFAGVSVGLLVIAFIFWWQLGNANATIETQRTKIAECEAARKVQNAAIAAQAAEGQRQREAFSAATAAGAATIREAQGKSVVIVRNTPASACRTPPSIMEAGL